MFEAITPFSSVLLPLSSTLGHAKEALDLARMQEQTTQLEHQTKVKVWLKHTLDY